MDIVTIAHRCHNNNKMYCESIGDNSQVEWDKAPDWQKESAIKGVNYHLNNSNSKPCDSHNSWLKEKTEGGWVYGEVKDPIAKTHYCIVAFEDLPKEQQLKDTIFLATVHEYIGIRDEYVIVKDIIFDKIMRKAIDNCLQVVKDLSGSRERRLCITKLQEGIMWLGMDLKRLNEPNPYPDSYNSTNSNIKKTADNLLL